MLERDLRSSARRGGISSGASNGSSSWMVGIGRVAGRASVSA
jgi:hypothetical protein